MSKEISSIPSSFNSSINSLSRTLPPQEEKKNSTTVIDQVSIGNNNLNLNNNNLTYKNIQINENKPPKLPEGQKLWSYVIPSKQLDPKIDEIFNAAPNTYFDNTMAACKDPQELNLVVQYLLNKNNNKEQLINIIATYQPLETIKKITNLRLSKPVFKQIELWQAKNPIQPKISDFSIMFMQKAMDELLVSCLAVKYKNTAIAEKCFSGLFNRCHSYLTRTQGNSKAHQQAMDTIGLFIGLLKPQYQEQLIFYNKDAFIKDIEVTTKLSGLLIKNQDFVSAMRFMDAWGNNIDVSASLGDQKIAEMFSMLGNVKDLNYDREGAAEAFEKSYKVVNNIQTLVRAVLLFTALEQRKKAQQLLGTVTIKDENIRVLEIIVNNPSGSISKFTFDEYLDIKIDRLVEPLKDICLGTQFTLNKDTITAKDIEALRNKGVSEVTILSLYLHYENFDEARKILSSIPSERIEKEQFFREAKILLNNNSTSVEEIISYKLPEKISAETHSIAAVTIMASEPIEFEKELQRIDIANAHLQEALKHEPHNEDYLVLAFLNAVLQGDKEKIQLYYNQLGYDQVDQIIKGLGAGDATIVIEQHMDNLGIHLHPKQINKYYEIRHAEKLRTLKETSFISTNKDIIKWHIKGDIEVTSATPGVKKFEKKWHGLQYYGYILPTLNLHGREEQYNTALGKGFSKNALGKNGIKFLSNDNFKLKINKGERLLGTKYEQNGRFLIVFSEELAHDRIIKKVKH